MEFCTIFSISITSALFCICACIYCTQKHDCNNCCNRRYCCLLPPSQVSNMPVSVNVITIEPGLPKYEDQITYDEAIFKNENMFKEELPPPEYIP